MILLFNNLEVSTHSRTEAAAKKWEMQDQVILVSTHSRTEAAAWRFLFPRCSLFWFQHTAARRRLLFTLPFGGFCSEFQHTAARRRLLTPCFDRVEKMGFNTQPHGGGCSGSKSKKALVYFVSTHSRTEAAAFYFTLWRFLFRVSTHSRTEAAAKYLKNGNI